MKLKNILLIALICNTLAAFSQSNSLIVTPSIQLPQDSVQSEQLIAALNQFLGQKDKPNPQNTFVWTPEQVETFILLDEIKGMDKSGRFKDDHFYKPHLTNVVPLSDGTFLVQLSYIGVNENKPIFVGSFELIAHKNKASFLFASPLKRNAASWQSKQMGDCVFYFKKQLNTVKAAEYVKTVAYFDKKLKAGKQTTVIYCCEDFPEVLKLIGVEYKADYNGYPYNNLSSQEGNKLLLVIGESKSSAFNDFDPHDLWHERLHNVAPRSIINKPIDEGCAYLYGGSWGMSWRAIFEKFKTKVSSDTQMDWLKSYGEFKNFGDSDATHLMAEYVVNALLVQKIEKEKGFDGVLEFLKCGKFDKANDNYFAALEKLTGITKANYNEKVWALIRAEK
jgi:hypothetical protein